MASGIIWIRGGRWTLPPQPPGLDLRAILPLPQGSPRRDKPLVQSLSSLFERNQTAPASPLLEAFRAGLERKEAEVAGKLFYSDPVRWEKEVGERCGLQRYELTDATAWQFLGEITALVNSAPTLHVSFDERPDLEHLIDEILRITKKYGPMGEVPGVVETGPHRRQYDTSALFCFHLFEWWVDAELFAETLDAFRGASNARAQRALFTWMQKVARDDLREVELTPTLRRGSVYFKAVPLTMRALLWQLMFARLQSPPRGVCSYCQAKFEIAIARGPAPEYCPEHQSSKYRMRVKVRVDDIKNDIKSRGK